MFGNIVPQHCKWAKILHGVVLEMAVRVVEWGWIYEMDMVEVVVVVEVDFRYSMELGMEDIEGNIEDVEDFPNKDLANHVAKIGFGVEMAKAAKERVCSNYFDMDVHKLEIMN